MAVHDGKPFGMRHVTVVPADNSRPVDTGERTAASTATLASTEASVAVEADAEGEDGSDVPHPGTDEPDTEHLRFESTVPRHR